MGCFLFRLITAEGIEGKYGPISSHEFFERVEAIHYMLFLAMCVFLVWCIFFVTFVHEEYINVLRWECAKNKDDAKFSKYKQIDLLITGWMAKYHQEDYDKMSPVRRSAPYLRAKLVTLKFTF